MNWSSQAKRLLALTATACSLTTLVIVTAPATTKGAPTPTPTATATPTPTPIPNTLLDTVTGADTRTFTGSTPRTYMGDGWTNNTIPPETTSVKITGFVLYMTSTTTQAYADVVARIQFWNNCSPAATPVFTDASGPLITVDLGPLNLTANSFTAIPVTLANPLNLPGGPGTNWGFALNFQGDTGGGLGDTTNLTSMITAHSNGLYSTGQITTGTAPQFGYFRNASGRVDFNFDSTDARVLAGLNGQGIGIIIFGFPQGNGIPTPTPTVTVPPTPTPTPTATVPATPTPPVTPTSTVPVTPAVTPTATPPLTPPPTPNPGALLDTFTGADTFTYTGSAPRTYMGDGWTNNTIPAGTTSLKITGLTLYLVSATTQAYTKVMARIQFWNNYNQAANTVFSNAAGPLIQVDLGPHNLRANTFTVIEVSLATPVTLLGGPGTNWGFAQNFLGDTGFGLIETNSLTSLLTAHSNGQYSTGQITTGTAPQFGFYRSGRTDFNFSPFDSRALAGVNAQGVGIVIFGTAQNGATPTPTPTATVSPTATPCLATTFSGTGVGPIPDGLAGTPPQYGPPLVISFDVSGLTAPLVGTSVDVTLTHSWAGDLDMILTSPGGTASLITVSRIGVTSAGSFGDSSNFNGVYNFTDSAPGTNIWTVATAPACNALCDVAPGNYLATAGGTSGQTNPPPVTSLNLTFAGLTTSQINGTWSLTIRDAGAADTGSVTAANLSLAEACGAPTPTPPPNPTPTVTATIGITPTATPLVTPGETSTPSALPTPQAGTLLDTYTGSDPPVAYTAGTPRTYMGDGWTNNGLPAGTTFIRITALRLYMACLTSQTYLDVVARIQFWNSYTPNGRQVFRNPAGPPVTVDLGSIITAANSIRQINVTLTNPVILTGGSGTSWGFSQNFQADTGNGLADTPNLTSVVTTHSGFYNFGFYSSGQITTGPAPRYGFYRNASERTDFNFDSDDVRYLSPQYGGQGISIMIVGTAQSGPTPTPTPPGPPTPTPPPPTPTPIPPPGILLDTIAGADTTTFTGSTPRTYMGDSWTNNTIPAESTSVKITGLTLYLVSATDQTYSDVVARIQFWNVYNQAATPVFTDASGPLITVDLGPQNLTANSFRAIPVTLATPVTLPGGPGTNWGFTQNFQGNTGTGLADTNNLTSLITAHSNGQYSIGQITTGTAPQFGYYRNASGRTDFNFNSADVRTLSGLNAQGLGIVIFGTAQGNETPTPPPATPTPTVIISATPLPSATSTVAPEPSPTATATPTGEATTAAINLSTRMRVQVGDKVGIGGFIITGSTEKHVVVRSIGPSLTQFGLTGVLADPILELHGPSGFTTVMNDNWRDAQSPPSVLTPTNDLESAIEAWLPPGAYTAVVKGKNNTSGVALVEIYDLSPSSGKLGNISTRAFVDIGDNIVIAGMVLGNGTSPDRVVVRGIAPSLAPVIFTESAILANPTLELRDENGTLIDANNDWHDNANQAAEIMAAGLAPSHNLEPAIAASLPPGFYTVLLAGLNGGTGIGLVEIYDRGP